MIFLSYDPKFVARPLPRKQTLIFWSFFAFAKTPETEQFQGTSIKNVFKINAYIHSQVFNWVYSTNIDTKSRI
jgi:hypothetical protein